MSVINEMLKDLDKRKAAEQPAKEHEVYVQSTQHGKQGVDYKLLIIAILVTGIVCFAVMSFLHKDTNPVQGLTVQTVKDTTDVAKVTDNIAQSQATKVQSKVQPINEETLVTSVPLNNTAVKQPATNIVKLENTQDVAAKEVSSNKATPEVISANTNARVVDDPEPVIISTHNNGQTPESVTKSLNTDTASLTIATVELTPKQLADKKYKQAMRAINNKDAHTAEKLLEEALILSAHHLEARKQLAALWFGRQANGQAINVLAQGIALTPKSEELRIMQARIYAGQGEFSKAFNALKPLSDSINVEYQQALATMASQAKQFPFAVKAYQKLIVLNPEQGRWWLGMAIALDSDGQYQQATLAYQKALHSKQLSQSSINFVNTRLMELGE